MVAPILRQCAAARVPAAAGGAKGAAGAPADGTNAASWKATGDDGRCGVAADEPRRDGKRKGCDERVLRATTKKSKRRRWKPDEECQEEKP